MNNFGKSINNLQWKLLSGQQDKEVTTLKQRLDIPEILARVMVNRGVSSVGEAQSYLAPRLRDSLPDPFLLKDMDKAADRIAEAIIKKQKITIFADYDVDGATSSALLRRFLQHYGVDAEAYIPHRIKEGYGPSVEAMQALKEQGNDLVITVDCGTVSHEPLATAAQLNLDVIVLDHHLGGVELPQAVAVVNPNRFDEDFPDNNMAAVGVVFLAVIAVRQKLRDLNHDVYNEPDLMNYLDLVALGTVCDVMCLQGINRAFVAQGLKIISRRSNVGIATLANLVKINGQLQAHHLGYILGPRINAGGRVGDGYLGSELLSTDDPRRAYELALKLEALNDSRRSVESEALAEAYAHIENNNKDNDPVIFAIGQEWHQGILGILASRIKERYNKPCAVISLADDVGKGSARSIVGIDLGTAISLAKSEGLLLEGGGHAMAGGFTIHRNRIDDFYEFLAKRLVNCEEIYKQACEINIDAVVSTSAINESLVRHINQAAPFGSGNPQPRFALQNVRVLHTLVSGRNHIVAMVCDKNQNPNAQNTVKCVLFKGIGTELGEQLLNSRGKVINIAGSLQLTNYGQHKVDFVINDIAIP